MNAKDRTQSHEQRLNCVRELWQIAGTGSDGAVRALGELTRHQDSGYDVKKEATSELMQAREAHRGRRPR